LAWRLGLAASATLILSGVACERPLFMAAPVDDRPLTYDGLPPSVWVERLADERREPWAALTAVNALASAVRQKDRSPDPRPKELQAEEEERLYETRLPHALRSARTEHLVGRATASDAQALDGARPRLVALAGDSHDELRAQALCALGALGPRADPEYAVVLRGLAEPGHHVRECALLAAANASRPTESLFQQVRPCLLDRDAQIRSAAIGALRSLAPGDPRFLTDYGTALDDPEVAVRIKAAQALARIGPAARSTTEKLRLRRDKAKNPVEEWEMNRALQAITREAEP
jgi:HEAT repeat protein